MKAGQPETLTNFDKGNALREIRKRLGLTLEKMSEALGLHWTYLSQLENGRRNVDGWYIEKAEQVAAGFEKSKEVKVLNAPDPRTDCREHLERFLESCEGRASRLNWTLIELQTHFPPNKWRQLTEIAQESMEAAEAVAGVSSSGKTPLQRAIQRTEEELAARRPSRGPKPTAVVPSEQTGRPARGAPPHSGHRQSLPEKHPKK